MKAFCLGLQASAVWQPRTAQLPRLLIGPFPRSLLQYLLVKRAMLNDVIFGVEVLHDPLILYEDQVEISKKNIEYSTLNHTVSEYSKTNLDQLLGRLLY